MYYCCGGEGVCNHKLAPAAVTAVGRLRRMGGPAEQHCPDCGTSVGRKPAGINPIYYYCGGEGICNNDAMMAVLCTDVHDISIALGGHVGETVAEVSMAGGHAENFTGNSDGTLWKTTDNIEASVLSSLSRNPQSRDCLPQIYEIESGVAGPATARQEGVKDDSADTGVRVRMENLTADFVKPCIMDVKFGVRSYERAGYKNKPGKRDRLAMRDSETTTLKMGMRLSGMNVVRADGSLFQREAHQFGRTLDPERFIDEINDFFCEGPERLTNPLPRMAASAARQMGAIERFLEKQIELSFVGSSVLFIREGDADTIASGTAAEPKVRMIDFAHTLPPEDGPVIDSGYHFGAANMVKILSAAANNTTAQPEWHLSNIDVFAAKGRMDLVGRAGFPPSKTRTSWENQAHYDFHNRCYSTHAQWLIDNDTEDSLIAPVPQPAPPAPMMGGHARKSTTSPAVQDIEAQLSGGIAFFLKTNGLHRPDTLKRFNVVEYSSQVVAGTMHRLTVDIGKADLLNIAVFECLPCNRNPGGPKYEIKSLQLGTFSKSF